MVRGLHKTIRHGSQQDPFEREFEDKLVLGGDMLCLGLYAYTQAIVDFAVKTADLDDVGDPERLLTKGFRQNYGQLSLELPTLVIIAPRLLPGVPQCID